MTTELDRPPAETSAAPPAVASASARLLRVALGLVLIGAGLAGGLVLLGDTITEVERSTTTHLAVERVVFDLDASGDVTVVVGEPGEIVVEQRKETTFRELETSQEVVDGELRVSSRRCAVGLNLLPNPCSASFVVTVPPATSLGGSIGHGSIEVTGIDGAAELATGHGSIAVTDTLGDLDLDTGHGAIEVTRAGGAVSLDTGNGAVSLTDVVGPVSLTSGHGAVSVRGASGDLSVRTGNGSIHAEGITGEVVALRSGHGSLWFAPGNGPADVSLATSNGDVTVRLPSDAPPYAVATEASGRQVDVSVATDPQADRTLTVSTGHGRIDIGYATS